VTTSIICNFASLLGQSVHFVAFSCGKLLTSFTALALRFAKILNL
jgi:hypothetical protein